MQVFLRAAVAMALIFAALDAHAIKGTFVVEGGTYSITLEEDGANLVVVEPNKRSVYAVQSDGSYTFHNRNTGSDFYIRVLDDNTIEAGRVPLSGQPSVLRRVNTHAVAAAFEENDEYTALAKRYAALAESDPDNAQAWTMCSAVAFKRAMSDGEDYGRYAQQTAQVLKQILVDGSNPCVDAIPAKYW